MKLNIIGKHLAECSLNLVNLKRDMKATFNLEKSIKDNITVIKKGEFKEDKLKEYMFLGIDWATVLVCMYESMEEEMTVRFYPMKYKDKVEFKPKGVTTDSKEFVFDVETKEGIDVLMVNSFIAKPDFNIKNYFTMTTFNYGSTRWNPIIDL